MICKLTFIYLVRRFLDGDQEARSLSPITIHLLRRGSGLSLHRIHAASFLEIIGRFFGKVLCHAQLYLYNERYSMWSISCLIDHMSARKRRLQYLLTSSATFLASLSATEKERGPRRLSSAYSAFYTHKLNAMIQHDCICRSYKYKLICGGYLNLACGGWFNCLYKRAEM